MNLVIKAIKFTALFPEKPLYIKTCMMTKLRFYMFMAFIFIFAPFLRLFFAILWTIIMSGERKHDSLFMIQVRELYSLTDQIWEEESLNVIERAFLQVIDWAFLRDAFEEK